MIWVTSDTHFGHTRLREYTGRPEDVDSLILSRLDAAAGPKNSLIHLGDVSFGSEGKSAVEAMLLMPFSSKVLVRGNHDQGSFEAHLRQGWSAVQDGALIRAFGKNWLFTHRPAPDSSLFDFNVHGHLHNAWNDGPWAEQGSKYILIAPEWMEYRPISLENLAKLAATPVWCKGKFQPWHDVRPPAFTTEKREINASVKA